MEFTIPVQTILLRLGLAMVFGIILGWEREAKNKPAGLKTLTLVAVGSASFALLTLELFRKVVSEHPGTSADPLRIVDGIIGGIGFLGAGAILQSQGSVKGITTASGIWIVGAIGVACGAGYYLLAALTFALTFLTVTALGFVEDHYINKK